MYNNPYYQGFNNMNNVDRINAQIEELQKMKNQMQQQPTNLTQNFQLAPTNQGGMKYANTLEEVNKETVYVDTPYFSKDMSVLWLKKASGETKTYELKELVYQDEKDAQISYLMSKIDNLEKEMKRKEVEYAKPNNEYVDEQPKDEKSSSISKVRTTKKK